MKIVYPSIKPIGNKKPAAYADIIAHTRETYPGDLMTATHELSHGINNDIANANGGRQVNVGLYLLNDVGFVIKDGGCRIQDVAQKIPNEFRGGICQVYDLYCIKQAASWSDRPLYLSDEWIAYTNGAITALQLAQAGDGDTNRWSELQNAIYFNMFVSVTYSIIPSEALKELIIYNLARVDALHKSNNKFPALARQETTDLLNRYYGSDFYKPFAGAPEPPAGWGFEEYI